MVKSIRFLKQNKSKKLFKACFALKIQVKSALLSKQTRKTNRIKRFPTCNSANLEAVLALRPVACPADHVTAEAVADEVNVVSMHLSMSSELVDEEADLPGHQLRVDSGLVVKCLKCQKEFSCNYKLASKLKLKSEEN